MTQVRTKKVKVVLTNPSKKIRAIKFCRAIVQDWLKDNVLGYSTDDSRFSHLHFGLKQAKHFVEGVETEIPADCIQGLETGTFMPQSPRQHMNASDRERCRTPSYHENSLVFEYEKNEIEALLHREVFLQRKIQEHKEELADIHRRLGIIPKWTGDWVPIER